MRIPARLSRALEAANRPAHPLLAWHEAFIRALPCVACGKPPPSECASAWGYAGQGAGFEWRRLYLLPLCGPETVWQDCCHSRMHFQGSGRFWAGLGVDARDLARRLWVLSGDREAGERLIRDARRSLTARQARADLRGDARGREPVLATSAP